MTMTWTKAAAEIPAGKQRGRGPGVILWLLGNGIRQAPRRLVLEAVGIAFPVAMLAATLLYVDDAVQSMTPVALAPVQVEMRAIAKTLDVDVAEVSTRLAQAPGVRRVEPFAAASVTVAPGTSGQVTARLFAVDPAYLDHHDWAKTVSGSLAKGALISQSVLASPGFEGAKTVTISLPGDAPDLNLTLPIGGTADLRNAATWFSVPYGAAQGDIVTVPRAIIIDYATYVRDILPVLKKWAGQGGLPPFDPGGDELPKASLEAHVTIDHATYPPDPGAAEIWTGKLQKALGLLAGAPVIVADNAAEALTESKQDATNAKILFLLLGIPGVLVAAVLGLTGVAALIEANRREVALLRMRGATTGQIAGLSSAQAVAAGIVGSLLGLLAAGLAVSAVTGRWVWQGVPAADLAVSVLPALAAGAITSVVRVIGLRKAASRAEVAERHLLVRGWMPVWRRAWLDIALIIGGLGILAVNILAGGLKPSIVEGPALALSFYVLLAPVMLWLGVTLLVVRGLLVILTAWSRPERARPLPSWRGAALRWLARRPAQPGRALATGALAIAFGVEVLAFAATYQTAKQADVEAAVGSDLRLTPGDPRFPLPALGPMVAATSAIRIVPARVDSDRKSILAIDPKTYAAATTVAPRMIAGEGFEGLLKQPNGVLINSEIAKDYELTVGDKLPLTSFPDDFENASEMELPVVGIFSSFPPSYPVTEVVTLVGALPRADTVPPDYHIARVADGQQAAKVAESLRNGPLAQKFVVTTIAAPEQRGLTALNLTGLGLLEAVGASLIAAVGVALLGAFIILERRRELAILHAIGAGRSQLLTGPLLEGASVALGSLLIGIPVGLGLGMLSVRVLGLFFALEPPILTLPWGGLAALTLFMITASALALAYALTLAGRAELTSVLREP